MRQAIFTLLAVFLVSLSNSAVAEPKITVKHYQQQARYHLGLKILDLALSKLDQPYEIKTPEEQLVNEKRGEKQVIDGQLDLQWMSTTKKREQDMIPIKVPLYRGILGLRLLLVKKERKQELSGISNLEDLQQYTAGHGTHWGDLPIYDMNHLKVTTNVNYEKLFHMLYHERFDYFHRGLTEIWAEHKRYSDTLDIADNVMLFYPHVVYFFVTKKRPDLASKIELGLKRAITDGSYQKLFMESFGQDIVRANLESRQLIVLKNEEFPPGTRIGNLDWWLPKKFQSQINGK